jgi:hypothetical protein
MGNSVLLGRIVGNSRAALALVLGLATACAPLDAPDADGALTDVGVPLTDAPDAGFPDALVLDGGDPGSEPRLMSATAAQIGRFGEDLHVALSALDADGDMVSLSLGLLGAAGAPLLLFDTDGDGIADSHRFTVPMPQPTEGSPSECAALIPNLMGQGSEVEAVEVAVLDAYGHRSEARVAEVALQPLVPEGGSCDLTFVRDRCETGLSCRLGSCEAGSAPVLLRAAFLSDGAASDRVLVEGFDRDGDLSQVVLRFLDDAGEPMRVDLDRDGVAEAEQLVADVRGSSTDGALFFAFAPGGALAVDAVSIVLVDAGGQESDAYVAQAHPAPLRTAGAACDVRGFDRCSGSVCMPSAGQHVCVDTWAARREAYEAAPVIDPFAASHLVGVTGALSLWDPPSGCSAARSGPEAVVRLHLDRAVSRVVLSTEGDASAFDTVMYVVPSPSASPTLAWCEDDGTRAGRPWLSRLELFDLPRGDYVVVIDAASETGGPFELEVTAD